MANPFQKFAQRGAVQPAPAAAQAPVTRPAPQPGPVGVAPAFARPQAAPAMGQPGYSPPAGRYSGIAANAGQYPQPSPGRYRFKVLKTYESKNPRTGEWFHGDLEVVFAESTGGDVINPPGSTVTFLQGVGSRSASAGLPRVKSFTMASAGFDDESNYNAFDPRGAFLDAVSGVPGMVYEDGSPIVPNPLGGRYVDCVVTLGKPVVNKQTQQPTGEYYRNYNWSVVAEEEQGTGSGDAGEQAAQ